MSRQFRRWGTCSTIQLLVCLTLALAVLAKPLGATTFVLGEPDDLFRAADVVVLGSVAAIESVGDEQQVRTNVEIAVERSLKTALSGVVTLVEPGGDNGGRSRWLFGAPRFYVGERVLVFARRTRNGELRTLYLGMGKFRVVEDRRGVAYAVRNLGEGTVLHARSRRVSRSHSATYRLNEMWSRLAEQERKVPRRSAIVEARAARGSLRRPHFVFSGPPAVRWFTFDESGQVGFSLDSTGDLAIGPHNSRAAVEQALAAWSRVSCSSVQLRAEREGEPTPFSSCDGVSQISFNDPFDEIDDPTDCVGVLGVGGVCGTNEQRTSAGSVYSVVQEGDVMIANGFGGCSFWNIPNLTEIVTHEVGHALGLAHSSDDPQEDDPVKRDATMYFRAHFDYRGAYLGADDRAAVCALYPRDDGSEFFVERSAVMTVEVDGRQRQRLVLSGSFLPARSEASPDDEILFVSVRVGQQFLVRLAIEPDQWLRNGRGNRWRYRERTSAGVAVLDLVRTEPGRFELTLVSRNVDPLPVGGQFTLSVTLGDSSVTQSVRLRRGLRALFFP